MTFRRDCLLIATLLAAEVSGAERCSQVRASNEAHCHRIVERVLALARKDDSSASDPHALGQVATLQARLGDLPAVKKTVDWIPSSAKRDKVRALAAYAEALWRSGDVRDADAAFREAVTVAEARVAGSNNPAWASNDLSPVVESRLRLGDVRAAVEVLAGRDDLEKSLAALQAIEATLREGELGVAGQYVASMPMDADCKVAAQARLGRAQADAGFIRDAHATLRALQSGEFSPSLGRESEIQAISAAIAVKQASSGDVKAARRSLSTVKPTVALPALVAVRAALKRAGQQRAADKASKEIESILRVEELTASGVTGLIRRGQLEANAGNRSEATRCFTRAIEIAQKVRREADASNHSDCIDDVRRRVAREMLETGDLGGALRVAASVKRVSVRAELVHDVARNRVRVSPPEVLFVWAESLPTSAEKCQALLGIAEGLNDRAR